MARTKHTKPASATGDAEPTTPSMATRRTTAAASAKSEPKRSRRTRSQDEKLTVLEAIEVAEVAQAVEAVEAIEAVEIVEAVKVENEDNDGPKHVGEVDGETAEEPDTVCSLLPGAFSAAVDTPRALRVIVISAVASSVLALGSRMLVNWIASTSAPSWAVWTSSLNSMAQPTAVLPIAALGIRMLKLVFTWDSIPSMIALDVLAYGPIAYLLASFYDVPLPAVFASGATDLVANVLPLAVWKWWASATVRRNGTPKAMEDPVTLVCSYAFAAILYNFVFVQACRFFLPGTLVVHFLGIITVEPARALTTSPTFPQSINEAAEAIFLSWPSTVLSFVCGIAAHTLIFSQDSIPTPYSPAFGKAVTARVLALSTIVGGAIFQQCVLGIRGVDATGAAAFASVWVAAPLLVGTVLGLART